MKRAFISFANEDEGFANLVVTWLQRERVDVVMRPSNDCSDAKESKRIPEDCDALLVVLSIHAVISKEVATEIAAFRSHDESRPILSLMTEEVAPEDIKKIHGDLATCPAIAFHPDLTSGFEGLFSFFGVDIQRPADRRDWADRRHRDRRQSIDRRRTDTKRRFQHGVALAVSRAMQGGFFDTVRLHQQNQQKILDFGITEVERYNFYHKEGEFDVSPRHAFFDSIQAVFGVLRHGSNEIQLSNLANFITEEMFMHYHVEQNDRRMFERRSGDDRREA